MLSYYSKALMHLCKLILYKLASWQPKIHHLSTLPTRDNFVHCNHNLLSSKTMVAMNPPLGNSKPPNFGKPMDYSHHFHRVCYTGFRPTCAYGVLACGGAWELAATPGELYYSRIAYYSCDWVLSILLNTRSVKLIIT